MITDQILSWGKEGNRWFTSTYQVGGSLVSINIEEREPAHKHLCNYYCAFLCVDGVNFPIPGADVMQSFSIIFCKDTCQQYWLDYLQNQNAKMVHIPKMVPPPMVGTANDMIRA